MTDSDWNKGVWAEVDLPGPQDNRKPKKEGQVGSFHKTLEGPIKSLKDPQ